MPSRALAFNGERFTTAASGPIEVEHLHRYFLARSFCRKKLVLDVASGEGYGAAILGQVADFVFGLELDIGAVLHASQNYSRTNVRFISGSAHQIPLQSNTVDVVVSFETLEHVADCQSFLSEVARVLRPDGHLLISTPDREVYSPAGQPANPYHVHEFTRSEFQKLLVRHFSKVEFFAQREITGSAIVPENAETSCDPLFVFDRRGLDRVEVDIVLPRCPYLFAYASNTDGRPKLGASLFCNSSDNALALNSRAAQVEGKLQVFPFQHADYSEHVSLTVPFRTGEWVDIRFSLREGLSEGPLRIDPADFPCLIEIDRLSVANDTTAGSIWLADEPGELSRLQPSGTTVRIGGRKEYLLFNYGSDAQIILPTLDATGEVRIDMRLRVDLDLRRAYETLVATPAYEPTSGNSAGNASAEHYYGRTRIQLFQCQDGDYSEAASIQSMVSFGSWQTVSFSLSSNLVGRPLRLDPSDTPCIVQIAKISVFESHDRRLVWAADCLEEFGKLRLGGTVTRLPDPDCLRLFSYGFDARLEFPALATERGPTNVEVVLRFERGLDSAFEAMALGHQRSQAALKEVTSSYDAKLNYMSLELLASQADRIALSAQVRELASEKEKIITDLDLAATDMRAQIELSSSIEDRLNANLERSGSHIEELQKLLLSLESAFASEQKEKQRILQSRSWRITQFARSIMSTSRRLLRKASLEKKGK